MAQALKFSVIRNVPVLFLAAGLLSVGVIGCHQAPSPEVMATVNGKQIVQADVDRLYKQSMGQTPQAPSPEQAAIVRLNILRGLIDDEIVQQRAAKLNLVATDEEVNAKLTEFKAPYTQEEFESQLKAKNLTLEELKRDIRRTITKSKLINKEIESKINVTDSEISDYYTVHKAEFNLIEPQYRLAEIVVTNQPAKQVSNLQNSKAMNDADAKKKIQMLRNRLDSGDDFASLAMNYSEDQFANNGGDVGPVYESSVRSTYPEVFAAIDKLKAGQTTDVLPITQGEGSSRKTVGYALYMLIQKSPAGQREITDPRTRQTIRQTLRDSHAQLLQNAYYEMLHNDSKVHNYYAEQILKQGAS
ncbi:SurA N-terminal domain-containing protein [Acidicapsa ligni]|uniref:SurA N-terminal domain-containing protein n=1 Tax=Acidicapsa ligni TaxID=542300 RepID=UPI0021E0A7FD|nr:SurA N-terminal domain-containing protein [Acidicapsa ligni]